MSAIVDDGPVQAPKILIVSDDSLIGVCLEDILRRNGYKDAESSNGPEAVKRNGRDKPDLAIIDFDMKHLSGLTVVQHFQRRRIPTLIMSSITHNIINEIEGKLHRNWIWKSAEESEILRAIDEIVVKHSDGTPRQ